MRIFITGASGYVGQAVTRAFREKGHTVFGLVRSPEMAKKLSTYEVTPIIGDMNNPDSYKEILKEVDVAAHCAMDISEKAEEFDCTTIETILSEFEKSSITKTFIYTSGVWLYGSTNGTTVDENSPLNPLEIIKWRQQHEEIVRQKSSDKLRTVILRPGCVYGRVGGLTSILFNPILNGNLLIVGEGNNHWAMVHLDDLAHAYVTAVEKQISGETFNVVDDSRFTLKEIINGIAKSANIQDIKNISFEEAKEKLGPLVQGLTIDQQVSNQKIKKQLGWTIHHFPFLDEVNLYYNAWKASQPDEF